MYVTTYPVADWLHSSICCYLAVVSCNMNAPISVPYCSWRSLSPAVGWWSDAGYLSGGLFGPTESRSSACRRRKLGNVNNLHDATLLSYPLKKIVKSATRGLATLDKIYTNIDERYQQPFCIPPIGQSDHNTVVMSASSEDPRPPPLTNTAVVRRLEPSDKAFLEDAVRQINWSTLHRMQNSDECNAT